MIFCEKKMLCYDGVSVMFVVNYKLRHVVFGVQNSIEKEITFKKTHHVSINDRPT